MITQNDEVERESVAARAALDENLVELEQQAKELVDWRAQTRKSPRTMVGLAFGAGLLVAVMAGARRARSDDRPPRRSQPDTDSPERSSAAAEVWTGLKGALVGAVTTEITGYVVGLLPELRRGFEARRRENAARRRNPSVDVSENGDGEHVHRPYPMDEEIFI